MARLPGISSFTELQQNPPYLKTGLRTVQADDVVLTSGQAVAASPTYRIMPGTVLAKRTSTSKYLLATDANADTGVAATITSSGHTDANGVISITGNHGTISVTTATGTGTEAEHATDLNADADFAAHYTASSGAGELTIISNQANATEWFYVDTATIATVAMAEGVTNGVNGSDPEIVVSTTIVELQDSEGTAKDELVSCISAGDFDTSVLLHLTAQAKAVLLRNGSKFD